MLLGPACPGPESTFNTAFLGTDIYNYDYVLLPDYVLKDLYSLPEINLMVNMLSFQEMTREQVSEYLEFGRKKLSGFLYSCNDDYSPNSALAPETVTSMLSAYFDLFPPPGFYRIDEAKTPKSYFSTVRGGGVSFPSGGAMKFLSNFGDRYSLHVTPAGEMQYGRKRDWGYYLRRQGGSLVRFLLGR